MWDKNRIEPPKWNGLTDPVVQAQPDDVDASIGTVGYVGVTSAGRFAPTTVVNDARQRWLFRMVHSKRPLQERMTLFWHNHFATAHSKIAGDVGAEEATRLMAAKPSEDAAGFNIGKAALNAFDDFKLSRDIGRNRLGGEIGFTAPGAAGEPVELFLDVGPEANGHSDGGAHDESLVLICVQVSTRALCQPISVGPSSSKRHDASRRRIWRPIGFPPS